MDLDSFLYRSFLPADSQAQIIVVVFAKKKKKRQEITYLKALSLNKGTEPPPVLTVGGGGGLTGSCHGSLPVCGFFFEARTGPGWIQSVEVSVSFLYLNIQLRKYKMENYLILDLQMAKTIMLTLSSKYAKSSTV